MYGYVSSRILIFFIIILAILIIVSYAISGDLDENKFISFLKIFLFELPVAGTSAIIIVYTFFLTENRLATFPSKNLVSAFTPSLFFTISVVVIILLLQEMVLPYMAKQKLITKGVKDVVFAVDNTKYLIVDNVEFDKNKKEYILKGVDVVSKKGFYVMKSYSLIRYNPINNSLVIGGKELELQGNLEKVLVFFTDKNYFFSIWEFNQVKDTFFIFDIKTSFLNFVMYEKIFIPVISFVVMLFGVTIGWRWKMSRDTKLMPLYIVIGALIIPVAVKMIYYLSIRVFELIVFPF